ncbi:hypothetical protein [Brevundimonas sp.]
MAASLVTTVRDPPSEDTMMQAESPVAKARTAAPAAKRLIIFISQDLTAI